MSDLYNKASLVMNPQLVDTGKVYSIKPEDRKGDFTFTRSSAATRVNADGNIEKETQNLLYQSNNFNSGFWSTSATSVTSGQSGYDGSNDAWLLNITSGNNSQRLEQDITASNVVTLSIYAKAGTLNWIRLRFTSATSPNAYFDLENGVIGSHSGIDAQIESVGNGWYKCSLVTNDVTRVRIYPATDNGNVTHTSGNIYIQDAQLEQGLVARDYIETTTPVEGGITDNVPRLDYTDSSCPALLLEPQRTNKLSNSEYINNASTWVEENGADCTPNYATSPEGVDNATRVQLDNSGAFTLTRIWCTFTPDASSDTASFYAKSNTGSSFDIVIYFRDAGFGSVRGSKTITLTNEWQRFDLTADCSGAAGNVMFLVYNTTANENWDFLMYGAQVEAGSYATSYIPTYGTSVTRNNDETDVTGLQSKGILSSTQGTMFFHITDVEGTAVVFNAQTANNLSYALRFIVRDNGFQTFQRVNDVQTTIRGTSSLTLSEWKIAMSWNGTNLITSLNGTSYIDTIDASLASQLDTLKRVNPQAISVTTNQILVFPTQLNEAELNDLTTL